MFRGPRAEIDLVVSDFGVHTLCGRTRNFRTSLMVNENSLVVQLTTVLVYFSHDLPSRIVAGSVSNRYWSIYAVKY